MYVHVLSLSLSCGISSVFVASSHLLLILFSSCLSCSLPIPRSQSPVSDWCSVYATPQSERRLRERVSDLQERLEQSTNTARMLENYIRFLKTSYSKLFGTGEPPGESADDHGTARGGLFDLTGK